MPRFSPLKPKEVEKITVVPYHSRDIPKGTLKSIIKQANLPEELFFKR